MTWKIDPKRFANHTFRKTLEDNLLRSLFVRVTIPTGQITYVVDCHGKPVFETKDLDLAIEKYNKED